MSRAGRVADAFRAVFGTACAGVWSAPGRVNLIGEHTDYNGGSVLPLALPHRTWAAAAPRADGLLRLHSARFPGELVQLAVAELAPGAVRGWAAYPAGVAWALRRAGYGTGGADVHVETDVPLGAGLSSSAALEVAVALALTGLAGRAFPAGYAARLQLARLTRDAEHAFTGMPCGIMDQAAALCCTTGHVLHLGTRDLALRQVPFDPAAHGLRLLVVDTRVVHALRDGAYAARRAGCEAGARALGVRLLCDLTPSQLDWGLWELAPPLRPLLRHVLTEEERVARVVSRLEAGDPRAVGESLTAGHASLRDDFAVSCAELDLAVSVACRAGALGARMTGGGFGGSAVVLAEETDAAGVAREVGAAFAAAGHRPPRVFAVEPADGARRDR
ncbi:galactokinase [Streptomyces sp. AV19]|uniref:galactokinase n=1 Tax=Streptomyces sp. AV19 TaxID=2793068 RepID=UPI0018FEFFC7|nr:galactokinase [Streptomyces sp. AV19]MBH1935393.1 galactokinase [Streptomyces sp. AV19]MDG4531279.1 galactokinase [Streptomyces sp. AV19]